MLRIPEPWQDVQNDSRKDAGRVSGLDQKINGTDQTRTSRMQNGMMSLNTCCSNFSESGHPVFRGTSALERGALKNKGGGQLSIHFCGDPQTVEVVFAHPCFRQSAQCLRSSSGYV